MGRGRRENERRGEKDYDRERQKENGEGTERKRVYLALSCADQDINGVDFMHFKLTLLVLFPAKK